MQVSISTIKERRLPVDYNGDWGSKQADVMILVFCIIVGVLLSTLPHIVWWQTLRGPVWIADNDDLLYAAYGSQAYYNHPCSLADPVCVTRGASMYPWLQFIPGVVIAKILGLGSISINLVWRIIAG